ncbi:hypothetical protein P279_29180 [Rhodobacteraceae bacterium PD-2]|nr:hypothetical protein P279_29180 [Rhodobacteraceae bacterium PD-2]
MILNEPADAEAHMHVLQGLILPDPELCDVMDLHLRLHGRLRVAGDVLHCAAGSGLRGDTYYNLFNIGKWQSRCGLRDLALRLRGSGRFEVTVWHAPDDDTRRVLTRRVLSLAGTAQIELPMPEGDGPGVLYYELHTLSDGRIDTLEWVTAQAPLRQPDLMLSVTTFRREEAVARTAARFAAFRARSPLAERISLLVVDNGSSAQIAPAAGVQTVRNENLGGSGGFARGLLEARARGVSHCLFMDDDAAIHMQSLERTWTFLAYATDPSTAVIGAISSGLDRGVLWENGALFESRCRPLYNGVDLRSFSRVLEMELETTLPQPENYYGGWWYFAFPLDHATHMPFPFFVRGDDISFSLANDFAAITLPGVMCFQDLDFSERESPLTLYLDLRSHLVHHLALPEMVLGRWKTARIAAWFFARSLCSCHYETLAALNLAVTDALRGPMHFARTADMVEMRTEISGLRQIEVWRDLPNDAPLPQLTAPESPKPLLHQLMKCTLNGHLLPFFSRWGARVTLAARHRGSLGKIWGASRITYVDRARRQTYTVHHDKRAMLREGWRMTTSIARLIWRYDRLRSDWTEGYTALTGADFWPRRLGLSESNETPRLLEK